MLTPKFFIAKFIVTRKFSYTKHRITPKCLQKGKITVKYIFNDKKRKNEYLNPGTSSQRKGKSGVHRERKT